LSLSSTAAFTFDLKDGTVEDLLPSSSSLQTTHSYSVNTMTLNLTVPKLVCSACVDTVTHAVKTVDPDATVQAEPKTKQVVITTQAPTTAIKDALAQVGYPAV
jgi:copper chaperone